MILDLPWMAIIEYTAAIGCAAGATALAFKKKFGWVALIIGCSLYGVIFLSERLYANFLLQVAFIVLGILGIINAYKTNATESDFQTSEAPGIGSILRDASLTVVGIGLCYLVLRLSDDGYPLLDGTLSALSLLAQYWMARKYAISWILWLCTDATYAAWFILSLHMRFTGGLYIYLSLLSIHGYLSWKKQH